MTRRSRFETSHLDRKGTSRSRINNSSTWLTSSSNGPSACRNGIASKKRNTSGKSVVMAPDFAKQRASLDFQAGEERHGRPRIRSTKNDRGHFVGSRRSTLVPDGLHAVNGRWVAVWCRLSAGDKAGKRFKCHNCGELIRVPKGEGDAAAAVDDFGEDTDHESTADDVPSHRGSKVTKRASKKNARKKPAARNKRWLLIGGVIAVVAMIGGGLALAGPRLTPQQIKLFGWPIGGLAYFILYDRLCRSQIRSDVEGYDGTIQTISWRPFQGAFFTRGWGRGKHARFYEVSYTNRDGRTQQSLVCCTWLGTNWDV